MEFDPDIPSADITLLATSAALVVRTDLDPSLVSLLTYAVVRNPKSGFDKTGEPILFYKAGEFPNGNDPEFELASEARSYTKLVNCRSFCEALLLLTSKLNLPFWPAAFGNANAARSILLLIPLLSIILPLMRLLPMIYNWSMRRRLLYWYRELKTSRGHHRRPPYARSAFPKAIRSREN